jgi:MFS family permease
MTGVYYSMDIPSALHQPLRDYMRPSFSPFHFNLLYTLYSVPNIILPFFGGYLVDSLGASFSATVFASFVFGGQFLFAWGLYRKSWTIMFGGRFLYGLGGECIGVATSTINSDIFKGKELALAFGVNLAVSRLGSVLNNFASPRIAHTFGIVQAGALGVVMNFISLICCLMIWKIKDGVHKTSNVFTNDEVTTNTEVSEGAMTLTQPLWQDVEESSILQESIEAVTTSQDEDSNREQVGGFVEMNDEPCVPLQQNQTSLTSSMLSQIRNFPCMFWLLSASCVVVYGCVLPFNNIASGILLERNYFTQPPEECILKYPNECSSGTLAPSDGNSISYNRNTGTICNLPDTVVPIVPLSIHVNKTALNQEDNWNQDSYDYPYLKPDDIDCNDPFWSQSCTANFCKAQSSATEESTKIMSIPYILSATLSPFFGFVVDRIGQRAVIACAASFILIMVHASLSVTSYTEDPNGIWLEKAASPVIPLIGQGLAYVCYAAVIWPSIPLVVSEEAVGTAFGAIGLALFPLIIAQVYEWSGGSYIPNVEYFFVTCAVFGSIIGVWMNVLDGKRDNILNNVHSDSDEPNEQ